MTLGMPSTCFDCGGKYYEGEGHACNFAPPVERSLKVVEPREELKSDQILDKLEACGGDLVLFCEEYCPEEKDMRRRWLFEIHAKLSAKEQERWRQILQRSQELRLDLLQAECFRDLEVAEQVSAARTGYAKTILDELFTARAERKKKEIGLPYAKALAKHNAGLRKNDAPTDEDEPDSDDIDDLLKEDESA